MITHALTSHELPHGFRHAASVLTNRLLAVIAMAVCTLLGHQLFQLSRTVDLDAITSEVIALMGNTVASATSMHDYAAMLIVPAAIVGCMALGGLYLWTQKDG